MLKISVDDAKKIQVLREVFDYEKAFKRASDLAAIRNETDSKLFEYYGKEISEVKFQNDICDLFKDDYGIRGLEAGCGCGKTIIIGKICAHRLKRGGKSIVINPSPLSVRNSIKRDIDRCIVKYGVKNRRYTLSHVDEPSTAHDVNFFTIMGFVKLFETEPELMRNILSETDFIACDETHRYPEDNEEFTRRIRFCFEIIRAWCFEKSKEKERLALGVTGLWSRLDGMKILGLDKPIVARKTYSFDGLTMNLEETRSLLTRNKNSNVMEVLDKYEQYLLRRK